MNGYDKVVCVDDANQRTEIFDTPNGLLRLGRVYCVSGWSECGGLVLAGLPAICKRNGSEAGFRWNRIWPLNRKIPATMNHLKQVEPDCEPVRAALKKALSAVKKFAELEGLGAHGKSAEIRK